MERIILHCDMNNYYATVECMLNPALKGRAVAVCGSQDDRHGIVLAKSEEAKKYGVNTGDVIWEARRKCSELIIVPPHFNEYAKYSKLAREIYYGYTDQIEPFGIDECWLDVTGSTMLFGDGYEIAHKIKEEIKSELGLTISVGVSYNKIFAKLGSDLKKPDAITCIDSDNFKDIVWALPSNSLLGIGPATKKKLANYKIHTIGDVANCSPSFLKRILGKNGDMLWVYANGLDTSRVMKSGYHMPIKSIGRGITCCEDLEDDNEVWRVLLKLAQEVSSELRENKLKATGVQISIRDNELKTAQFQAGTDCPTQNAMDLALKAKEIFQQNYAWRKKVRAVTIRAINLQDERIPMQLDLFFNHEKHRKNDLIERAMIEIRNKYGDDSITMATLMGDLKMKKIRQDISVLPNTMFK